MSEQKKLLQDDKTVVFQQTPFPATFPLSCVASREMTMIIGKSVTSGFYYSV